MPNPASGVRLHTTEGDEPVRRTTPTRTPALEQHEHDDSAFERPDATGDTLRAAAAEDDGAITVWSADHNPVVIPQADEGRVITLLLRGKIDRRHLDALARAVESRASSADLALLELYSQLITYQPPRDFDAYLARYEAVSKARRIATDPRHLHRGGMKSSLLWTVNRDFVITSVIGDAADEIFEAVYRRARPAGAEGPITLFEYYNSTDRSFPPIAAHIAALQGESASYVRTSEDGHQWHVCVEPVVRGGEIIGVSGYKVDYSVEAQTTLDAEEMFCVLDASGMIVSYSRAFKRLFGLDPLTSLNGRSIVHGRIASQLARPHVFFNEIEKLLHGTTPTSAIIEMADGRTVHRYAHPVMNATGEIRSWAMYWTQVRRGDTSTTSVSERRVQ